MAFSEIELKLIDSTVGELCRRVPERVRDQLRHTYEIEGHSVSVFEERPHWKNKGEWTKVEAAKFRYFRSRGEWKTILDEAGPEMARIRS